MANGHQARGSGRRRGGRGNPVPFRKPGRAWRPARPKRGWGFSPIMVMLPLAAFTAVFLWGGGPPGWASPFGLAHAPTARDPEAARFGQCRGREGTNCVIDGDSLRYQGRQIRIADIDAPELGSPKCAEEFERGERAEARLQQLLNAGPFRLEPTGRERDRYGRELYVLTREGESLGATLVAEGLAHEWRGSKRGWCS